MDGIVSYILSKKYTDNSVLGISGALAGKNCTISDITKVNGVTTITFKWTADDSTTRTSTITVNDGETPTITVTATSTGHAIRFVTTDPSQDVSCNVEDGISVTNAQINASNHLIITLSDASTIDAGEIVTATNIEDLDDVDINTPSDGESLVYNSTSGKWENKELSYSYALEDLTDVDIDTSSVSDGDIIKWSATDSKWVKGDISINEIVDIDITTPTEGQILKYDAENDKWVNENNEVVADIDDLGDVEIDTTSLTNNQILKYNATSGKWENGNAGVVTSNIEDLANVEIDDETLTGGQVLTWNEDNSVWVNQDSGGTSIDSLGDINDVNLTSLASGDILKYNGATSEWANTSVDSTPTQSSTNTVTSGGVYTAIKAVDDKIGTLANLDTTDTTDIVSAVNEIVSDISDITNELGDLTTLETTVKTDLVSAINEVVDNVGDLTTLTTTDKSTIVDAINELVTSISDINYLEQFTTMSEASDYKNRIVQYVGSTGATYTKGYVYQSKPSLVEGSVVYSWEQINVQPYNNDYANLDNLPTLNSIEINGDKVSTDYGLQDQLQYSVMPTADASHTGMVVQYVGGTTSDYTMGYFYKCVYDGDSSSYIWTNVDVSGNTSLLSRIVQLETNQGDMSTLEVSGADDIIEALNILNVRGISSITYSKPYLTITLADSTTFTFDVTAIISATNIGDLGNVLDTTVANTNLLQYDSSISKYKPYDIVTVLSTLLSDAKDYTDQEIASAIVPDALVCDAKPTYDSTNNIVIYYQNGTVHTTTATDTRFYYTDTTTGTSYCTSWIGGVEFTFDVATVDYTEYVNKNTDLVDTYTVGMLDKTKVPTIASMDDLYTITATAISFKVNTADIVDNCLSTSTTVPLSANQGRVIFQKFSEKQDVIQYSIMPTASVDYLGDIIQYTGESSAAYVNGRFYKCAYDIDTTTYSWEEIKFSADYDSSIIENSTNAPQGGAVYTALADKQNKTLDTTLTIEGTAVTTVETALSQLNTAKAKAFQVTTMPTASVGNLSTVVQYIGTTTNTYTKGYFYECQVVTDTDPVEYEWVAITSKVDMDSTISNTSTNPVENQAITNVMQALQDGVIVVYAQEADRLTEVSYSGGEIVAVGTICYCVAEETWYKVTAINASSLAVTWTSYDPKIVTDADLDTKLEKVTALPTASLSELGNIYLLTATQTGYQLGGIYKCVSDGESTPTYSWDLISTSPLTFDSNDFSVDSNTVALNASQRIFKGTTAEWEALTTAQKEKYTVVILTDDSESVVANDYTNLTHKPSINSVTLTGSLTLADLGIQGSTLSSAITLGGTSYTTVEGLLSAMATLLNNTSYWQ